MPQSVLHHRTGEKLHRKPLILYQPELVFTTLLVPISKLYLFSVTVLLPNFSSILPLIILVIQAQEKEIKKHYWKAMKGLATHSPN